MEGTCRFRCGETLGLALTPATVIFSRFVGFDFADLGLGGLSSLVGGGKMWFVERAGFNWPPAALYIVSSIFSSLFLNTNKCTDPPLVYAVVVASLSC